MSWVLFTILAVLVWAVVNILDKYILAKLIKKPIIPVMVLGIIGLIASFLVYIFHGFSTLSYPNILLSFIAGIFYILTVFFYFKAVKIEEISRVVPLYYLTPLFVLILAAIFLEEIFTPVKYLGIFILIFGAILISSKNFKITLGKPFWFMIFSSLTLAINTIITKYLLNFSDFWTIFSYVRIGVIFALIPIFYFYLPEFISVVKNKKTVSVISLNETLNLFGILFFTVALAIGYATIVEALSSVQPFFVFLFAIILSIFYPKILKEEITKSIILQKVIAIILIVVGVILII